MKKVLATLIALASFTGAQAAEFSKPYQGTWCGPDKLVIKINGNSLTRSLNNKVGFSCRADKFKYSAVSGGDLRDSYGQAFMDGMCTMHGGDPTKMNYRVTFDWVKPDQSMIIEFHAGGLGGTGKPDPNETFRRC